MVKWDTFGNNGGTIIKTTTGGVTSNEITSETDIPQTFSLYQNYPNPFNPATNLSFVIDQPSFVSLKVYDILGNEVATLVNEERPAGKYEVTFNADKLSSGVYFYQLRTEKYIQTKKMLLLR